MLTERYNTRRFPLIGGLVLLIGSQIMFMEAPNYPVMCIARILQGIGSTMVWVVGLALLWAQLMRCVVAC
jgi:predicted MFS family arabinose efflux permease